MITEEAPDPLQQLQLINSMINKAKDRFSENGHLYLLWGWTILFCALGSYLLEFVFRSPYAYSVWVLPWLMLIYQFAYLSKKKKAKQVVTYTADLMKYVWLVFLILIILMLAVTFRYDHEPHQTNSIILVLYGMPTFLIGKILKFKPLITGALSCWLFAVLSLFIPFQYHMLLVAAGVAMGWIIPGYLLKKRYNKQL